MKSVIGTRLVPFVIVIVLSCVDDDVAPLIREQEIEINQELIRFTNYIERDWIVSSAIKCDSLEVTNSYGGFEISFSFRSENDDNYEFNYSVLDGEPAFPSSGIIFINKNTDLNTNSFFGFRDDNVQMRFDNLGSNVQTLDRLDFVLFDIADCEAPGGRFKARGSYSFRCRRRR